ncbi:MAG TPA: TldD/PmbA family protein [Dehalococcoidia bacterium]|nr:TldD/PmbA family protein [Dehalococcoidia bacterium]
MSEQELKGLADTVLSASTTDQTEVLVFSEHQALTRFANNHIHQNVEETDMSVRVRVVLGQKIGVATSNDISEASLKALVERATNLARHQVDNEDFRSLPKSAPAPTVDAFVEATARCGPEERASVVGEICEASRMSDLTAAGAFKTTAGEMAVANSLGTWQYAKQSLADIHTVVMGPTGSGYAGKWSTDVGDINGGAIAMEAVGKAEMAQDPQPLEPGNYEVILQDYAVADLLDFLAYLSFGGLAFQEKRTFMAGRIGEKVMGENVSIWDDGLSGETPPQAFDYEGVPKKRVEFISEGVAKGVVWDSYHAGKEKDQQSTGHALPAGSTFGPVPMNMAMAGGNSSVEEMIQETKRGIWVTRFWYTRPVHPLNVIITGMTRDGTFLIEDGKVKQPVRNLRFTQGYVEALNNVQVISRERTLQPGLVGQTLVPALKLGKWEFTGQTDPAAG